jgi:hypothetical protein
VKDTFSLNVPFWHTCGQCFTDIKNNIKRSKKWIPFVDKATVLRNIPNKTDICTKRSSSDIRTENPTNTENKRTLSLCSYTSIMWGLSPAAFVRYITVTAETDGIERTVTRHFQGVPSSFQKPSHSLTRPHLKWAYGVEIYLSSSTPVGASPAYVPIPHQRSDHTSFLNDVFMGARYLRLCWPMKVALH